MSEEPYEQLTGFLRNGLRREIDFDLLVSPAPYPFSPTMIAGFRSRYAIIKRFQETTLEVFRRSLKGEADPAIAETCFNEILPSLGAPYRRALPDCLFTTPLFFRTDEAAPGHVVEVQCPGSGWGGYSVLEAYYAARGNPACRLGEETLASRFNTALASVVAGERRVLHLLDNASLPHTMIYFINASRKAANAPRYWGYDPSVKPYECNVIRSHDFLSLISENFSRLRRRRRAEGELIYDHPPICLFDQKVPLCFPFWERTRSFYDDEIRSIFPYTQLIEPDRIILEDGSTSSFEAFCQLPPSRRDYFLKYAGCDPGLNWGSRAVYHAANQTRPKLRSLLDEIGRGFEARRYWVIQKGIEHKEPAEYLQRSGSVATMNVRTRFSGYYGPTGLLGLSVFHRKFTKVHGSSDTVMNICH